MRKIPQMITNGTEEEWIQTSEALNAGQKLYFHWVDWLKEQTHQLASGFARNLQQESIE